MILISMITQAVSNDDHSLPFILQTEGDHRSAAIEWRRLALQHNEQEVKAGYYWMAAYQYLRDDDMVSATRMLDKAEEASWGMNQNTEILRANIAVQKKDYAEAIFYLDSFKRAHIKSIDAMRYANKKLAAIAIQQEQPEAALSYLENIDNNQSEKKASIHKYMTTRKRNPAIGGLLGFVPGLGYAYAGEYGNAIRSLILNSIFIYGMIDTAQDESWGAFAAITFFEITWYSGSIYGGIDASHRFNHNLRDTVARQIDGGADFGPDWNLVPEIVLQFSF